jgi:hypothetical protein
MVTASQNDLIALTRESSRNSWTVARRAVALSLLFALLPLLAIVVGPFPALAGQRIRRPAAPNSDATLYEVTETVRFDNAAGLSVTIRNAIATLLGSAKLGTALCPTAVLITNAAVKSCAVAGQGQDSARGSPPASVQSGVRTRSSSTRPGTATTIFRTCPS